jgi:hypothetical protein
MLQLWQAEQYDGQAGGTICNFKAKFARHAH